MRISFERMNYETECYNDILTGNGFIIKEPPYSDVDKTIRNEDGPRSPRYGTTYGDNNEFMDRYHCKCGHIVGAAFEGDTCPICKSVVSYNEPSAVYTGWLSFSPFKVVQPLFYQRLQSAIGKKNLEDIIGTENIITANGVIRNKDDDIEVKKTTCKYHNIGMDEFYRNYEEIMEYFKGKRKQRALLIQSLIDDKDYVWTSKIPVYSIILRSTSISPESYFFSPIDRHVNPLVAISMHLKKCAPIEVPLYLAQAQSRINELWKLNFMLINGKHGWLRGQVLGGDYNFSGRSVIVLDPTLKMDEVDFPYRAFLEQYKGLIIKRIMKDKGWSLTKTKNYLSMKFKYDPYIYSIMCDLVDEGIHVIINRNPPKLVVGL